ncbi:OVARIAN TUMOR DOMAIN-containing deubiquitinating enzyme 6-like [Salvia miltiorrhiza]|uniref:OVARIAN TUMOR DOMAIN-containing deubiquitinating enzyme 6-like n=1 Tax=Salvia miltiorrhiza TaxID=226208 RepID=UPI0025AC9609|nr:OVARIAN TUMOR DOMAIN-containing deubiquitinating enzyme 6-like [Salvia miltiorrhiza]XP_057806601.1 OVARIAN TUMOR DOMAIN-containing deubiquitinating enzyme 6-like [Salvia miltiorrhiza]XP_057807051.1 OVARIAN TUMOR DOMAIN-containing deubiquitinating enzyme 6-like [Salvia miltiorrhiza]XP_057807058.1 OVARIAN TUMOR DOMAIN-containing deubiquitinating enzyme 6-like [Salvia miltiorrhiza]
MTRILVQRGSSGSSSSSNQNRSATSSTSAPSPSSSSASPQPQATGTAQVIPTVKDENLVEVQEQNVLDELSDHCAASDNKSEDLSQGSLNSDRQGEKLVEDEIVHNDDSVSSGNLVKGFAGLSVVKEETDAMVESSFQKVPGSSYPPPPPVPPPKPSSVNSISRRSPSADPNAMRIGPSRRPAAVLPGVSSRSSPTGSRPSSPRSHCEGEGYNSADEQSPNYSPCYDDAEREHQFEIDLRRVKGLEVRKMLEDGNCLFRAVADQVYGDSELYDLVRQMCIDYMERERDHFSQFITEGFTSYCKRKRRDKVYGNNVEIQALSEMYNRPIHIYSYSTEPINIFHGTYNTDTPPIRLSYHHGNHYNSLVDPRRLTIGAGLGFSSLQGTDIDKGKVKAAIKAQQDQQIDNALLAEGRFYSDLELTEKEIERMVMEASRAEYLADDKFKQQVGPRESSTSRAEPSSSAARSSGSDARQEEGRDQGSAGSVLSGSMQVLLSMGFSYLQVIEAYSIFGDDVDSMICYLIEMSSSGRNKGKATEK